MNVTLVKYIRCIVLSVMLVAGAGYVYASGPQWETVRTTAEQTIHSADRITRALTLGTQ